MVLAIAGLIFLVVFLALPALQNSQKDTARKQDVGQVVSALQSYMADHQGSLDSLTVNGAETSNPTLSGYVGKLSQHTNIDIRGDSNGDQGLKTADVNSIKVNPSWGLPTIFVSIGESCVSGSSGYSTSTSTDASVYALLSNGTVYCASM